MGTTGTGLEDCATGLEEAGELVAMGITLSEVMVSQGVDEGEALEEAAATLEGVGIELTEPDAGPVLEGRGAGPVGT